MLLSWDVMRVGGPAIIAPDDGRRDRIRRGASACGKILA